MAAKLTRLTHKIVM